MARMRTFLAGALFLLSVCLTGAAKAELLWDIRPEKPLFALGEKLTVFLTLKNTGQGPVLYPYWQNPCDEDSFSLEDPSGKKIPFSGPLVKRLPPTQADMRALWPGESLRCQVDLAKGFRPQAAGKYDLVFSRSLGGHALRGKRVSVVLVGSPSALALPSPKIAPFEGCGEDEKGVILQAQQVAMDMVQNALSILSWLSGDGTVFRFYQRWFGFPLYPRQDIVKGHFDAIAQILPQETYSCACSLKDPAKVFAYTNPDLPYELHLCPVFWETGMTGIDSKAGTLVHETGHFVGLEDIAYGFDNALALAQKNPSRAIYNADSHEYFAEEGYGR